MRVHPRWLTGKPLRPARPPKGRVNQARSATPGQHQLSHVGKMRKERKMAWTKKHEMCQWCTQYWPEAEDSRRNWQCLAGMAPSLKCTEFVQAIFQFLPEFDYSMRAVRWTRKAENSMKKAEGLEVDEL